MGPSYPFVLPSICMSVRIDGRTDRPLWTKFGMMVPCNSGVWHAAVLVSSQNKPSVPCDYRYFYLLFHFFHPPLFKGGNNVFVSTENITNRTSQIVFYRCCTGYRNKNCAFLHICIYANEESTLGSSCPSVRLSPIHSFQPLHRSDPNLEGGHIGHGDLADSALPLITLSLPGYCWFYHSNAHGSVSCLPLPFLLPYPHQPPLVCAPIYLFWTCFATVFQTCWRPLWLAESDYFLQSHDFCAAIIFLCWLCDPLYYMKSI